MDKSAPGKPVYVEVTASSILLNWSPPQSDIDFQHYEVKYRVSDEKQWRSKLTDGKETDLLFTDLKSKSTYLFRVRVVFEDGDEGPFSTVSDNIKTRSSPVESIKKQAVRLSAATPQTYQLPVKKEFGSNPDARTRKCVILNDKPNLTKMQKTIMVVGPTGSGKSTLIEGIVNYVLGVSWDDDCRFKLIDLKGDEKVKKNDQTLSQTDWITSYCLNWTKGFQIDFNLNIIDTPGFGDTRGIVRDKELVEQVRQFFTSTGDQGVDELNAVCFVVKASEVRLTPTMRYIFDSILAVFGNDIEKHIHILMTFADGDEPPALNAVKAANVPFQKAFAFNNSALFVNPAKSPNGTFFWKMGKKSFEDFFIALKFMEARSLKLTSRVLQKRRQLEIDIMNIQRQVREGTDKLAEIHQHETILDQHRREADANKNFTAEVTKPKCEQVALDPGVHTTTCFICNRTCHERCAFADNADKASCSAMKDGYCQECPNKCIWSEHKNVPYRYEYTMVIETITFEQLKKTYEQANEEVGKKTTLLDRIKTAFNELREKNLDLVKNVKECINELQTIALKTNPLSSAEYIELLIETEREEKKPGFENRMKMLEDMKKQAIHLQKIAKGEYKFPEAK